MHIITPIHTVIGQTIRNFKSHFAFTGPWKAKIDQYYMHAVSCDIFKKKCDNDILTIFWKWYDIRYHDISLNDTQSTGLKYQIGKISGDVTDTGQTKTSEESVTQLLICKSQKITRGQRHSWRADHALSQIKYETNLIVSYFSG